MREIPTLSSPVGNNIVALIGDLFANLCCDNNIPQNDGISP